MNYRVIYKLRDSYTMQKYGIKYTELPKNLQKEARREYPMRLSQANVDEE